jgi:hypothetical protein
MVQATKIIGTGLATTGLFGASVGLVFGALKKSQASCVKQFSSTAKFLAANPNDGDKEDTTEEILDYCRDNNITARNADREYFTPKETSIREAYRQDSNSAAIDGGDATSSELDAWMSARNRILDELARCRDDVMDLLPDDPSDDEGDGKSSSGPGGPAPSGSGSGSGGGIAISSFTQDTSDIVSTVFDSSDYYDDF